MRAGWDEPCAFCGDVIKRGEPISRHADYSGVLHAACWREAAGDPHPRADDYRRKVLEGETFRSQAPARKHRTKPKTPGRVS